MQFDPQILYSRIAADKWRFLAIFFAVVLVSYTFLYVIDFIPEPVTDTDTAENTELSDDFVVLDTQVSDDEALTTNDRAAQPLKLIIDALDKEVDILNPTSRAVADLDTALLSGVVRHPDSADFVDTGNIFILGHSSYLPKVINKNFQAFNGIQKLTWGDTIRLQSADTEYIYQVDKVFEAKAAEVTVPLDGIKPKLTLATCNSFGNKDERFVVEATLVREVAL